MIKSEKWFWIIWIEFAFDLLFWFALCDNVVVLVVVVVKVVDVCVVEVEDVDDIVLLKCKK